MLHCQQYCSWMAAITFIASINGHLFVDGLKLIILTVTWIFTIVILQTSQYHDFVYHIQFYKQYQFPSMLQSGDIIGLWDYWHVLILGNVQHIAHDTRYKQLLPLNYCLLWWKYSTTTNMGILTLVNFHQ